MYLEDHVSCRKDADGDYMSILVSNILEVNKVGTHELAVG